VEASEAREFWHLWSQLGGRQEFEYEVLVNSITGFWVSSSGLILPIVYLVDTDIPGVPDLVLKWYDEVYTGWKQNISDSVPQSDIIINTEQLIWLTAFVVESLEPFRNNMLKADIDDCDTELSEQEKKDEILEIESSVESNIDDSLRFVHFAHRAIHLGQPLLLRHLRFSGAEVEEDFLQHHLLEFSY